MTNKPMLSVERELLERITRPQLKPRDETVRRRAITELRALLSEEPIEPFNIEGWSIDHSAGRPILMHNKCSVIEAEQAYGLLGLIQSAAQQQGEPVPFAWFRFDDDQKAIFTRSKRKKDSEALYVHPTAYRVPRAEQPAPVAVVLPDRLKTEPFTTIDRGSKNYKAGYNAALTEVSRLSGVKP